MVADTFWESFWASYEPVFFHLNERVPVASLVVFGIAATICIGVLQYLIKKV